MYQIISIIFIFLVYSSEQSKPVYSYNNVQYLENGEKFKIDVTRTNELQTFCYEGKKKNIIYIWQSVIFQLQFVQPTENYDVYQGSSPEEVQNLYSKNNFYWSPSFFNLKKNIFKVDPFNTTCIGVKSRESYMVHFNIIDIDFWKVLQLMIGLSLFLSSSTLSKNTLFHYISGVLFGICASTMILIYFCSKIIPRKPFMYGIMGMGWTLIIYMGHLIIDNIQLILTDYKFYILWYIIITGFISFMFCYRWGPVENQRTINLIKWFLQFVGLCAIFNSSTYQEVAMAQIVVLLICYNLPQTWKSAPKTYWKKRFPPKIKLLSNDEFYQQGVRETTKALDELRKYCSSPECNQWKTVLKLKDVKRFASFMEGNSHLSDDEILEYETFVHGLTDDEESELTDED